MALTNENLNLYNDILLSTYNSAVWLFYSAIYNIP